MLSIASQALLLFQVGPKSTMVMAFSATRVELVLLYYLYDSVKYLEHLILSTFMIGILVIVIMMHSVS